MHRVGRVSEARDRRARKALAGAEPKTLLRWTELVLPALKGEPHAQARAVVEQRLPDVPRPQAEKIAEFLGIRLRRARLSSVPSESESHVATA